MRANFDVLMFVGALVIAGFFFGYAVHRQELFPSVRIERAISQADRIFGHPHHLSPVVYDRSGARVVDREAMGPGLTLVTTYWRDLDWRPGIKLIDADGRVLHQWLVDVREIWAEADPERGDYVHGTHLFPDGDILFNIEHGGVIRMDACGKVIWRSDYLTHHSIWPDPDGTFWLSGNRTWRDDEEGREYLARFPGLLPPIYDGQAFQIDGNGKLLRRISMLEAMYANGFERYMAKVSKRNQGDIIHLNDVEVLTAELASEYPSFETGDIVVSLKFPHLVFVMDPDTGDVKWHDTDTFMEQHDPDFMGNGWIGVFDNNGDFTPRGTMLKGSRIIAVRPHTGERKILYPTALSEPFFTLTGGKWQTLSNGNLLLTEARAGRIVEAAPDGRTVWDWVSEPYDDEVVPEVLEATRYPFTPDQVKAWACAMAQ